mmetsp:Transcript_23711/g.60892  ORF Transcript_23711/g.60892 Transcript_23711/m.60892 type:complete len:135 (-) Transcript_23711:1541-1945(-)|eukprot:jgi/Tetstr1/431177/TSEL_020889.t1
MGGKPSREPEAPAPPAGYEPVVRGRRKPDPAPPPGWYWSHDTYFTCPGVLCPCFCQKHRWVLRPQEAVQPAYGVGGVTVTGPDGSTYMAPKVEQQAYNGPTYGNQPPAGALGQPVVTEAGSNDFFASQKPMPSI